MVIAAGGAWIRIIISAMSKAKYSSIESRRVSRDYLEEAPSHPNSK
jgi:hypothetical protein